MKRAVDPSMRATLLSKAVSEFINTTAAIADDKGWFTARDLPRFKRIVARLREALPLLAEGALVAASRPPGDEAARLEPFATVADVLPEFEALCAARYDHAALVAASRRSTASIMAAFQHRGDEPP